MKKLLIALCALTASQAFAYTLTVNNSTDTVASIVQAGQAAMTINFGKNVFEIDPAKGAYEIQTNLQTFASIQGSTISVTPANEDKNNNLLKNITVSYKANGIAPGAFNVLKDSAGKLSFSRVCTGSGASVSCGIYDSTKPAPSITLDLTPNYTLTVNNIAPPTSYDATAEFAGIKAQGSTVAASLGNTATIKGGKSFVFNNINGAENANNFASLQGQKKLTFDFRVPMSGRTYNCPGTFDLTSNMIVNINSQTGTCSFASAK